LPKPIGSLNLSLNDLHLNDERIWQLEIFKPFRTYGERNVGFQSTSRMEALRKEIKMKCASDYDSKNGAILRQADECVEEWWEPQNQDPADDIGKRDEAAPTIVTAEAEALRRGLIRQGESGELCLSCPEEQKQ
jgi:hypothetical protein